VRTLMKSLVAVSTLLALAPSSALALPMQCAQACLPERSCDETCAMGSRITTCAEYLRGDCNAVSAPIEERASLAQEMTSPTDEAAPVCSEEPPSAES
jgi:hypothetical protein